MQRRAAWLLATTLGEPVAFAVPVLLALALAAWVGEPETHPQRLLAWLAAVAGGAAEGTVLGAFQARVLPRFVAARGRDWVRATALGAAGAWGLALVTPLWLLDGPPWLGVLGWLLLGLPAMALLTGLQARVLSPHVPRAWRWTVGAAACWALAVAASIVVIGLVPTGSPWWGWVLGGLGAGLAMGAVVGVGTAWLLGRLAGPAPPAPHAPPPPP